MPDNPLFNVLLLNDDDPPWTSSYTSCRNFFELGFDEACKLVLRVHHEGKAICGTYERDEAEARVVAILALAHKHNHPLKGTLEEAR